MLHAVWLAERFLHHLLHRNCNFDIVFFDDSAQLCVPSHASEDARPKYLLARAVILRHLQAIATSGALPLKIMLFPSLHAPQFRAALAENSYMFVMMNDGAADDCSCHLHKRHKSALRLNIGAVLGWRCTVVLLNGLEWRDSKVFADIIEGAGRIEGLPEPSELNQASSQSTPSAHLFEDRKYEALAKHHQDSAAPFTERLYLVAAAAAVLLDMPDVRKEHVAALLAHAVLQSQLRLGDRALCTPAESTEDTHRFLHAFAAVSRAILESSSWDKFVKDARLSRDVADLVDGRLFRAVLSGKDLAQPLSEESTRTLKILVDLIASLANNTTLPPADLPASRSDPPQSQTPRPPRKLLPFQEPVFDKILEPIKLEADSEAAESLTTNSSKTFRELTHWHNSKRPLNRKDVRAAKDRSAFYARRRDQRFMTEMMNYAASLTNAVGKVLEPETIVVESKEPGKNSGKDNKQPAKTVKPAGGKNKRAGEKQAMLDNIAAEKDKKEAANNAKIMNAWHSVCKEISKAQQPTARHAKVIQYFNSLPTPKQDVVRAEVELYALSCLLELWKKSVAADPKSPNFGLAARIWDSVARLKNTPGITATMASKISLTIDALGLPFSIGKGESPDRKLPFEFALSPDRSINLAIPLPSREFQLLHCGPYFDRKMDSAPDDRVPFLPDGWQRKVLDVIDAEKSLFVVAPTSAGKTFISFYAMKKVLEGSDEGVLVYVAPTKALVNQIAAEIQARFSKTYKHAGKSVWGIHTRDYRVNNATGCQVLVTVPHILQTMLLAPAHAESWSCRIKRIIYDEVHCIGQAEDGLIWEQLLLQAPYPIIALSATVGNPEEFYNWLSSAQKAVGIDLVMVHHPHRYSELRKFVYVPPKDFNFTTLPHAPTIARIGLDKGEDFKFVHPVAGLLNRARGIPDDFSLEARDCYTLWQSMKAHETETHKVPDSLNPEVALPKVITQADVITWNQSLKALLKAWMEQSDSPFEAVVRDLGHTLYDLEKTDDEHLGSEQVVSTIMPLLCHLQEQSALPAILFNYDRSYCEATCESILAQLESAEKEWKETSPAWTKKMAGWEAWKKSRKGSSKKTASKKSSGLPDEGMGKADLARESAAAEVDSWESFDPDAPIDGFHFTDKTKLLRSELDNYASELRWRGVPDRLIEALSRGIGVHHAGMNRKYRHVVELLFRRGYLRVVVATGTLALGINMPCKTVVFCGDSIFLTALNFRQAAGRAGRRGFDVLGNVVFHGVPVSKVCRLLSSRLPDLTGHFPITTTLVLRLNTLLSESKHSEFATRSINALLSQPRLYLGGEENRMAVLHHLRFSIEYLRRQFLLDRFGNPLNFAGCVSHLYYTESSNFAFHALLKDGYFHRLCAGIRQNPQSTERITRTLMLVLSHLFGRIFCRQADQEYIEEVVKNSPSTVILPPLPEDAAEILRQHNQDTLDIFSTYVHTFVDQHIHEDDNTLPLSNLKFGGTDGPAHGTAPTVRSHFVALSGHTDDFSSVSDLCSTVRSGVFLEEAVIPYVPVEPELPLNAYLLDFFKHGDVTALAEANKIKRGDVWFVLNDFSMVLATIVTSLTNFITQSPDGDHEAILDAVGRGDAHEEQVEDRLLEEATAPREEKKALPVQVKKPRKKAVADSWDDDAEDDEDQGAADGASADGGPKAPAWEDDGEGNLLDVLDAFKKLSDEFNEKFKAMWA
ncbi:hypothetical protein B0J12DRAFT_413955 [Macrophomina phaseolina]|uniref:Helicase n=1 Tax=Macrophomina phaseolina TaxID=35725 RepID=A0ABQ8GJF7_9PEZI|nr:hypothetical protein B0J12DRAFT_413955 [Macrophomina phaseolina]